MIRREDFTVLNMGDAAVLLEALNGSDKPLTLEDLRTYVINGQACLRFMEAAEADGLIDIEIQKYPHRKYQIEITDFGREIASFLLPAFDLVAPEKPMKERSISRNYADPILRALRANGTMLQKELMTVISSWRTLKDLLDALEEDGLIESEMSLKWKKHWLYRLTPLGKVVANAYQLAFQMINERKG